jgi:hypothetical protein
MLATGAESACSPFGWASFGRSAPQFGSMIGRQGVTMTVYCSFTSPSAAWIPRSHLLSPAALGDCFFRAIFQSRILAHLADTDNPQTFCIGRGHSRDLFSLTPDFSHTSTLLFFFSFFFSSLSLQIHGAFFLADSAFFLSLGWC